MKKKSLSAQLTILWSKFIAMLIQAGAFVSHINSNITGKNFPPQSEDLEFRPVKIISIKKYLKSLGREWLHADEVLAYLDSLGLRPATLLELLLWWKANPAKHSNCFVVALGQVWRGLAPCVYGDDGSRNLYLYSLEYAWHEYCVFAAVRKAA